MPLKNYGVLVGKAIEVRLATSQNAHYQVHLIDDATDYRIAVNVLSNLAPSEVEYLVVEEFDRPILDRVKDLQPGFTPLAPTPTSGALDYIRGNLFAREQMQPLPYNIPGPDNDLNDKIDRLMQRALSDEDALVYAFGERWGPERDRKDKFFGFLPGNGIHDIHMNQANSGNYTGDDGVWQDGGLFLRFPRQQQWAAIFLKFQSQAWHSDDATGHALASGPTRPDLPDHDEPNGLVRIVAALVNSVQSPEVETVTLLNTAPHMVSLAGWHLCDTQKRKMPLHGNMAPGQALVVQVEPPVALSNKGGIITLTNQQGLKVDGVAYTRDQARHPGWTLKF